MSSISRLRAFRLSRNQMLFFLKLGTIVGTGAVFKVYSIFVAFLERHVSAENNSTLVSTERNSPRLQPCKTSRLDRQKRSTGINLDRLATCSSSSCRSSSAAG